MKEFFRRLRNSVVISSIVSLIYIFIAPKCKLPDWAVVSSQILAIVYAIFGITSNPTDKGYWEVRVC